MLFFKIKNLLLWVTIAISLVAMSILFYLKFDMNGDNVPLYAVSIPIAIILVAFTFYQIWQINFETDPAIKMIYSLDQPFKIILTIISSFGTICYIVSIMFSLYLIEQRKTTEGIKF